MEWKNIRLLLSYDGNQYHGWQRQRGEVTIQGTIEEKLYMMLEERVRLVASGRTDAGVHALNQVSNFQTRSNIPPFAIKKGLNSLLPLDILVKAAEYVPMAFHARYDARSKTYEYRILNKEEPDIFRRHYSWHIRSPLDVATMRDCLSALVGGHDFSSFRSSGGKDGDPFRSVMEAKIHGPDDDLLRVVIEADGFLRHMVRNVVGTIVEVGLGKMEMSKFAEILRSRDRKMAGVKAPPQGLFLVNVNY
jgi:tRNA pseudouridine38-40 synthase